MRDPVEEVLIKGRAAREAANLLRAASTAAKNQALLAMADALEAQQKRILEANAQDIQRAERSGASKAFVDRLRLTPERIQGMATGLRQIAALEDPVGKIEGMWRRPNGMWVGRMRVPIGVIAMIYEARPNVTVDAAGLCVKAGNAAILRGGSEAVHSNRMLVQLLSDALATSGLPASAVQTLETTDHAAVIELARHPEYIDLVIPRGSEALIRAVVENARVPVLKHFKGVCHVYVDREADQEKALRIVLNAKVQRPSVCNAMETLLVDQAIAQEFLHRVIPELEAAGVEVRGCPRTRAVTPHVKEATEDDWSAEYLDLVLAVRVVDGLEEAIAHIQRYSTGLADAIVTENYGRAMRFVYAVDSAAVLVNASTRLVDGGEFGLGAEIGISTDRLHARGPMGLEELTTKKFVVLGSGQVRE
ncbi:MAG: glutamate-5-semialdehyde dehydrogenase [Armatimonadota bacterium]|nr:glutamate-5-semialdehyde dehydrogenase [Armatimonadota bacterium]